jgi:hypothetical protein
MAVQRFSRSLNCPKFMPARDRFGSASMPRRSTQPTLGFATAVAPNSRRRIRRRTCQEWRRRGSSMRLEAAFQTDSSWATPSSPSSCQETARPGEQVQPVRQDSWRR